MEPLRILVICRDPAAARDLEEAVQACGMSNLGTVDSHTAAGPYIRSADALLADASSLEPADIASLLSDASRNGTTLPCLVSLRGASIEDAVDLMRRGAFAVLGMPMSRAALDMHLKQAARHRELQVRNAELERSLEVHERLAMIGKLAAGVAHELNNPLDGVLRYVNFAIARLPQDAEQVTYLMQARQGLRRMADIVRDLLQFSRNASVDAADEDAERLARDAVEQVVAQAAPRRFETIYEFPPTGLHVPRAVFQVLGNLAKNAVDAMPQGGKLRVGATVASGRVKLYVADDGAGIPEEIRDRIFEPFFTTKEVGKGTGLGLSICQRIVERLGGTLTLESEVDRGTTVHVDLPVRPPSNVVRAARASEKLAQEKVVTGVQRAEGVF